MTEITIDADAFGKTLEQILTNIGKGVEQETSKAIEESLKVGRREWAKNARSAFKGTYRVGGWGKPGRGKLVRAGKYARSIRWHMMKRGSTPTGEIGSASMPGLAHLLEKGHAKVGGGFVSGRPHIEPAATTTFKEVERLISLGIERSINDA